MIKIFLILSTYTYGIGLCYQNQETVSSAMQKKMALSNKTTAPFANELDARH